MIDDDATPLLSSFNRNSSLRTATRRKPDLHPQLHGKPPRSPLCVRRLYGQSKTSRLRSQSVTGGEENRVPGPALLHCGATQTLDSQDWRDERRFNDQRFENTQNTRPQTQRDCPSHSDGSTVNIGQRNGYLSASLPHRKRPPSLFLGKWFSPLTTRRAEALPTNCPNSDQDASANSRQSTQCEMSTKSYRREKPPLKPKPPSLVPDKATSTSEQLRWDLKRHNNTLAGEHREPQQCRSNPVGRSTSVRQNRVPLSLESWQPVTAHQAERLCKNTLPSPGVEHNSGFWPETPMGNHKDPNSECRQRVTRGLRRHSSLPRPMLFRSNSTVEPGTHGRLPSPVSKGQTTYATTSTPSPTTPTPTGTIHGLLSPRSFRRSNSLNSELGSTSRPRETDGGRDNKDASGDGYCGRKIYSTISSDSGYSTCTSVSRRSSTCSIVSENGDDMIEWFGSHMSEEPLTTGPPTDHFSFLMENEKEYRQSLMSVLKDYQAMCSKTPTHIRQHFDLIFKQVDVIYNFQLVLQEDLQRTQGVPQLVAQVFKKEQFQYYGRFMVMMPDVQKDLMQYANHIKEHFPDLKRNILKPSLRLNFYAQILDTFRKEASAEVKVELEAAITYLNQVKRKANTEMTLRTVVHSPVDLRLGGDMLHIGEFTCISGSPFQKRKYQLILFENLLVITSKKVAHFKYKTHYRVEQLESVSDIGKNELRLNMLSEGQKQFVTLKFTTKYQRTRDEWIKELQKIANRNTMLGRGRTAVTRRTPRQRYQMLPLDLRRVFPLLREVVDSQLKKTNSSDEWTLKKIKNLEDNYLKQIDDILNPNIPQPPGELNDLLNKIYNLHKKVLWHALQSFSTVSDFLHWLVKNPDELSVYVDYLVVRSQLTVEIDDVPQAAEYILPVQHLYGVYFGMMKELCMVDPCRWAAQRVIEILQKHVEEAQVKVQEGAILNGRVDYQRSGKLIMYSILEVKAKKKEIRPGDYHGLLFENVIILTRPRQPYYEYVMDIWLDQANLGPPSNHESTFQLEVRQGRKKMPITYEMCATTPELKNLWRSHLHKQLWTQVDKIRQSWVREFCE